MKKKPDLLPVDFKKSDQEFSPRASAPPAFGATDYVSTPKPQEDTEVFLRGKKVLIVEDNLMSLYIAKTYLTGWGMEVTMVENGQQAVEAYQKNDHDVILMDIQMPIMSGIEAAKIIKSQASKNEVPIIAVTAHASEKERNQCHDVGMSCFLSKPYMPQDLKKALISVLGNNSRQTTRLSEGYSNGYHHEPLQVATSTDAQWTVDLINIYFTISLPLVREMHECYEKFDVAGFRAVLHKFLKSVKRLDIPPFSQIIERFLDDTAKVRSKQDLKDLTLQIENYVQKSQVELKDYLDQLEA
jgi:CheY-like chemotaxis protein